MVTFKGIRRIGYTLGAIVALGFGGVKTYQAMQNPDEAYEYTGPIGEEQVNVDTTHFPFGKYSLQLQVNKPAGIELHFIASKGSLDEEYSVQELSVTRDGVTKEYELSDKLVGAPVLTEGQPKFEDYLKAIVDQKIAEGVNALK